MDLNKYFNTLQPIAVDISLIKNHPDNPRIWNQKAMKLTEKSMKEFGSVEPLLVTQDYVLLSGHARLEILKRQGVEKVNVNVALKPITEKQQKKLLLYLNQNSFKDSSNNFDYDILANDWGLDFLKDDVGLTDWDLGLGVDENKEVEVENLSNKSSCKISFEFDPLMYETILQKIERIKKDNNFKTNELFFLQLLELWKED
jgi:hypothetical protein